MPLRSPRRCFANTETDLRSWPSLLLEKEVVFSEDLERIFGKRIKDIKREQAEAAAAAGAADSDPVSVTDAELAFGGETVAEPGAAPDWGEKPEK